LSSGRKRPIADLSQEVLLAGVESGYIPITQQSECFADTVLGSGPSSELIRMAGSRDPGVWRETEVIDHLQTRCYRSI